MQSFETNILDLEFLFEAGQTFECVHRRTESTDEDGREVHKTTLSLRLGNDICYLSPRNRGV